MRRLAVLSLLALAVAIVPARNGPTWYGAHNITNFSTRDFESSLSSAMGQAGSAMSATPRSSGSSGFSSGGSFSGGCGSGGSW